MVVPEASEIGIVAPKSAGLHASWVWRRLSAVKLCLSPRQASNPAVLVVGAYVGEEPILIHSTFPFLAFQQLCVKPGPDLYYLAKSLNTMHVILTGATGLVGSGVLDAMIKMKEVTKISILSRRPVQMAEDAKDPRINVIIHKDFAKYDSAVLDQLKGARGCVWALGISQTQVGKEEYVKITKDYALAASRAFQELARENESFNFVYVSGAGATTEPGRFSAIYARVKGETELALAALRKQNPLMHTVSARPAAVDASAHKAVHDYLPTPPLSYRMMAPLFLTPIRVCLPSLHSPTEELGQVLTEMAMGKHPITSPARDISMIGQFPILENSALRQLAASKS